MLFCRRPVFRAIVQSMKFVEPPSQTTPLPSLSKILQLVRVAKESRQYTAPPEFAEFPEIVQLVRLGEDS